MPARISNCAPPSEWTQLAAATIGRPIELKVPPLADVNEYDVPRSKARARPPLPASAIAPVRNRNPRPKSGAPSLDFHAPGIPNADSGRSQRFPRALGRRDGAMR